MRKLIVVGIIYVVILAGWVLYLEYDTKRFIAGLPQLPASRSVVEQQTPTAPVSVEYPTAEQNADVSENRQVPTGPIGTDDTLPPQVATVADTVLEGAPVDTQPEPVDTGLSPELAALFTAYEPIHRELADVLSVLVPLLSRGARTSLRIIEIDQELRDSVDGPERQALYAELEDLDAWAKSTYKETVALQDEDRRLVAERSVLFDAYGISSWREFERLHGETFTTWRSTR